MPEDIVAGRHEGKTVTDPADLTGIIADSWKRSRDYGVNQRAETLPPIRNRSVLTNIITQLNLRDSYFYEAEADLLAAIGAAIVFTNDTLDVFAIRGNRELKDKLRAINFRFGANLAESSIGTNALALSYMTGKEIWISGSEHYMSALAGYVCVASCAKRTPDKSGDFFFPSMIIIPTEKFQSRYRVLFSYILNTHLYRQNSLLNSNYLLYNAAINYLIGSKLLYYLSLDTDDKVVDVSDNLLEAFNLKLNQTIGCSLDVIFPRLVPVIERLDTAATGQIIEHTTLQQMRLFVRVYPVVDFDQTIGRILVLSADPNFFDAPATAKEEKLLASQLRERLGGVGGRSQKAEDRAETYFEEIIGSNRQFTDAVQKAKAVAQGDSNVLILGESGTGKDTFAQAIHNESPRKDAVFLRFNCASVPTEFIDTELFGFADGLGHGNRHGGAPGKIELANGGTLYLDEIGQLSLEQQRHLLHVLENNSVVRLGETEERPVDIRLITSSGEDLAGMVADGKFRADLYYRLNVFLLELPRLKEHISDIPALASHFCEEIAGRFGKPGVEISQEAIQVLLGYSWPGNVRELQNAIEYAMNLVEGKTLLPEHLPKNLSGTPTGTNRAIIMGRMEGERRYQEYELINELLERFGGNKSKVAQALGISRPALYRRLEAYGLEEKEPQTKE